MTDFVHRFHPKISLFRDLPKSAKLAAAWWANVDTERWTRSAPVKKVWSGSECFLVMSGEEKRLFKKAVQGSLGFYCRKHGGVRFGTLSVPVEEFTRAISTVLGARDDFGKYHRWYCLIHKGSLPRHPFRSRWPVIIDPKTGAIIDGYHRFHSYVRSGAKKIPCIYWANQASS